MTPTMLNMLKQSSVSEQQDADRPPGRTEPDCFCVNCPAHRLNLCGIGRTATSATDEYGTVTPLRSTAHVARARRIICHPKDWSEFVTVICSGWAASSIALNDGRRQILSILLPGDVISSASIFGATSGRTVEAITDVTYRKFRRADVKAALLRDYELLEQFSRTLIEEKEQADQLAVDLGRRTADERVARHILVLTERLSNRDLTKGHSIQFPLRRRHIADATGLTPVHVSKVLSKFQRSGLINIANRSLAVVDMDELRQVAFWR